MPDRAVMGEAYHKHFKKQSRVGMTDREVAPSD
jgi:hypothetical protein